MSLPAISGSSRSRRWIIFFVVAVLAIAFLVWWKFGRGGNQGSGVASAPPPVSVSTALVTQQDLPVRITTNGTVVALQAVEVRAQVASTIRAIHVVEGRNVAKGELLFTLDGRSEDANMRKSGAQLIKSRSDLANAQRNLKRQQELFDQKFISQAALDVAINQTELLKGQLAVDEAGADSSRIDKSFTEIRAPFAGRTGAIAVRVGSLVQPSGAALVAISQINPVGVAFALPERELAQVQRALSEGDMPVQIEMPASKKSVATGKLTFVESAVDSASGTIAMKATFTNDEKLLWPGMFINVSLSPRTLAGALVVPVQAVQSGPEQKFVYLVGSENKAVMKPVEVLLIQSGLAAVKGVAVNDRVVVEGAQNVRKDSVLADAQLSKSAAPATVAPATAAAK